MSKGFFIVHRDDYIEGENASVLTSRLYDGMEDDIIKDVDVHCIHVDNGEKFTVSSYLVNEDLIVPDAFVLVSYDEVMGMSSVVSINDAESQVASAGLKP